MAEHVTVTVNPSLVLSLARSPELYAHLHRMVDGAAENMRGAAPVRTGAGRASIRGQVVMTPTGWVGAAGWDRTHYYMGFQNRRRHFVEPALTRVRFV
jgi:hypothetical protein